MNYEIYKMTARDWIVCCGEYIIIISMVAILFYDSFFSLVFLAPFFVLFIHQVKIQKCKKRKEKLKEEFLNALQSISASLAAGFSPENAFNEAVVDLERMYGVKSLVVKEMKQIVRKSTLGGRIEDGLNDFAKRSAIDELRDFALIFAVAKKSGGSFAKIIGSCVQIMQTSKNINDEARVQIRGKQYEQRIMSIIPLGIIVYLRFSSAGFMASLYHNVIGMFVMTICLIIYVFAFVLAEYICEVDV